MRPNEIGMMLAVGEDPVRNIEEVKSLGLRLVQMGSPRDEWLIEPKRSQLRKMLDDAAVEVFTVFVGFEGESYRDIATIRKTVGFLNPQARRARLERTCKVCDLTRYLGAKYVGSHVGFIPEESGSPQYGEMVEVVRRIADYASTLALSLALETGQEPAEVLKRFIADVDRDNLAVNFDPANMILYGSGDPHEALTTLQDRVVSVHCKDGVRPTEEGLLGAERPLGEGSVDIPRFIRELKSFGYEGPLVIEREISGPEQVKDVKTAIGLLRKLLKES
jgi:sugar phosphate isomerase/epimerase